ncbi:MAG: hypothetical protein ABSB67_12645 [Bryobacteraceae bacterium]|jgi:hypothetical protein
MRTTLIQLVERVLVRLQPEKKPSKLSRLVPRDTIIGTLGDLERGQKELDDEMRTASENKWAGKH